MEVLILILISSGFASLAGACDKSELAAINNRGPRKFFIYAAEGTLNGSFDLRTFFHVLEFENTSHTLPFIVHSEWVTQIWLASPNVSMNAILYGCETFQKAQMRFIVYDNASWSDDDLRNHCLQFKEGATKFLDQINRCLEDFQLYSTKCQHVAAEKNFTRPYILFSGIFLLVAILIAACATYKYLENVSESN